MPDTVPDLEISGMITEAKPLPWNWQTQLVNLKDKSEFIEGEFQLVGNNGTWFRVIVKQHSTYRNNFTIVLAATLHTGIEIRLLRYDGSNHAHLNKIEGNRIRRKAHIHRATERYQKVGWEFHDGYAEATNRYYDLSGAWECFWADTNLSNPIGHHFQTLPNLFTEV